MADGVHVPLIPFEEIAGKSGTGLFWQKVVPKLNIGVIWSVISITMVVSVAHCPASGTNLQAVFPSKAVEIVAGIQLPEMPLYDEFGNSGGMLFRHNCWMVANEGTIDLLKTTFTESSTEHPFILLVPRM